ncbi:MAG: Asp-tRNA(Asn)/Glu-tRNA(Gln) amidotransferase subunit GatA [Pseudomonadota bacterium]
MHQMTIAELSRGLERGDFTSVELVEHFLKRIEAHNGELNAFITVTPEQALEAARRADALRAEGKAGPLTGVPMAHKDIFCTDGVRTSCGSKMLDPFIAPYDAAVVERMADAGMVSLGKLNMDEFAMGSSNETSYYGPVKNPWDTGRVPGGSSGGSAAAVAARLVPGATGTDTGGSIRQPAAFCGLTGLKPTYGRVSRYGMIAFASSLDQAGPLARSAEDCALMLGAMAGHDGRDSTSANEPVPDYVAALGQSLKGMKVGLPKEFFDETMPEAIRRSVDAAVEVFKAQGAEIVEVSLPNAHLSVPVYYVVAPAECSSNLSRMDGVRFGHRCDDPKDLQDLYTRSRGEGFGDEVKRRIMVGTYALSAGYYDAYYLKAQQLRQLISDDFKKAFESVDLLLSPTAPETAFEFGAKGGDPVSMYLSDIYTIAINLAGVPAVSLPAEPVDGLPVGLQLIGNYFDEGRLLAAAHQFQQQTDYHKAAPEAFA